VCTGNNLIFASAKEEFMLSSAVYSLIVCSVGWLLAGLRRKKTTQPIFAKFSGTVAREEIARFWQ